MNFVMGDRVMFKSDHEEQKMTFAGETGGGRCLLTNSNGMTQMETYPHLLKLEEPLMQFFRFGHLPQHLQDRSVLFWNLADKIVETFPRNPERTVALRKLLEAKDAAVRSVIYES